MSIHPFSALIATSVLVGSAIAGAQAQETETPAEVEVAAVSPEAINETPLDALADRELPSGGRDGRSPDPAIAKLQILLDREGASPGVIDGFDGDNVRKAVAAFEQMHGLDPDGVLDPEMIAALDDSGPVIGTYTITEEDASDIVPEIPRDYAEMAELDALGYTSVAEKLAERFHMDIDFLKSLNPGADFVPGEEIYAAGVGENREGKVAYIEADKGVRQVRAYAEDGTLLAAYPATIGSEENPSPSGTHEVQGVAPNPTYTYNPEINFQQGDNTEILELPPGPNGPVGTMWIDLSKPTFGIHGTPEPSLIDKVGSHGCVRLTNWDAEELSKMVSPGVRVEFL